MDHLPVSRVWVFGSQGLLLQNDVKSSFVFFHRTDIHLLLGDEYKVYIRRSKMLNG
jgi:hypothetical protein